MIKKRCCVELYNNTVYFRVSVYEVMLVVLMQNCRHEDPTGQDDTAGAMVPVCLPRRQKQRHCQESLQPDPGRDVCLSLEDPRDGRQWGGYMYCVSKAGPKKKN